MPDAHINIISVLKSHLISLHSYRIISRCAMLWAGLVSREFCLKIFWFIFGTSFRWHFQYSHTHIDTHLYTYTHSHTRVDTQKRMGYQITLYRF